MLTITTDTPKANLPDYLDLICSQILRQSQDATNVSIQEANTYEEKELEGLDVLGKIKKQTITVTLEY